MINNFQNMQVNPANRAFLFGDGVWVSFYVRKNKLIIAEECYFHLMASMRKLRMNIPYSYTMEFFQQLFHEKVINNGICNAIIKFFVFRQNNEKNLSKNGVEYYFEVEKVKDVLGNGKDYEIDIIKEVNVNTNFLSNIHLHSPENIYSSIYSFENGLDDVILLNPNKRIARTTQGNILLLIGNTLRIPKYTEGSYISPLLEAFITFLDKKCLVLIQEGELIPFETQKADEILLISETHGIHMVTKIRNKEFSKFKFGSLLEAWKDSFN